MPPNTRLFCGTSTPKEQALTRLLSSINNNFTDMFLHIPLKLDAEKNRARAELGRDTFLSDKKGSAEILMHASPIGK